MNQFKANGDVTLHLPLAPGFEGLLQDFLRINFSKSGFTDEESNRIAAKFTDSFREKVVTGGDEPQVEIILSHHPGKVTVRTRIEILQISDEQEFIAR